MLWDGNRQAQEYTDTHVFTTVYDQDSFEPVARLVWLKPSLLEASNDDVYTNKPNTPNNPIQIYHYHNDHLGTPNELTNNQGEVDNIAIVLIVIIPFKYKLVSNKK